MAVKRIDLEKQLMELKEKYEKMMYTYNLINVDQAFCRMEEMKMKDLKDNIALLLYAMETATLKEVKKIEILTEEQKVNITNELKLRINHLTKKPIILNVINGEVFATIETYYSRTDNETKVEKLKIPSSWL